MHANAASLNMASPFPPQPPSSVLLDNIIQGFSNDIKLENYIEDACSVCGLLTFKKSLQKLDDLNLNLDILICSSSIPTTRKERLSSNDPISPLSGPVLLPDYNNVCSDCASELTVGRLPINVLANGLWIGEVL